MRKKTQYMAIAVLFAVLVLTRLASASDTVIWYLPHPDDETIAMADSIHQSVRAGNKNYFIYFSRGGGSLVRHNLRGPSGEIHRLSEEDFCQARIRETEAALQALGVDLSTVLFLDFVDGSIPREPVEQTMRFFAQLYPGSIHRTVSALDPHEDHQTLARALASVAADPELDLHPEYYLVYSSRLMSIPEDVEKRKVEYGDVKEHALAAFFLWNPEEGRYAIASQSTPDLLEVARISPYEYVESETDKRVHTRAKTKLGLTLSTRDLGMSLGIGERLSLGGLFEYKNDSLVLEANYRLRDDVPFVQLVVGIGHHFGHRKPYLTAKTEVARNYFFSVRHVFQTDTSMAVGIATTLGQK